MVSAQYVITSSLVTLVTQAHTESVRTVATVISDRTEPGAGVRSLLGDLNLGRYGPVFVLFFPVFDRFVAIILSC